MFELSVACKYLLPRRRQLSVSIISLVSILVIALVVWLIVVFFSVTDGLEKSWIYKLTALTAPVRITPTEAYYHSYYYQIDSLSHASGYNVKTIREKQESLTTDPYDPEHDEEVPPYWPAPDRDAEGNVKDLVKQMYGAIHQLHGVSDLNASDFEMTASQIHLRLLRPTETSLSHYSVLTQSILNSPAYLVNFESDNFNLTQILLQALPEDLSNLLQVIPLTQNPLEEEESAPLPSPLLQERLKDFFAHVHIHQLKTGPSGWVIPQTLLPEQADWIVCAITKNGKLIRLIIPKETNNIEALKESLTGDPHLTVEVGHLFITPQEVTLKLPSQAIQSLSRQFPLLLAGEADFYAHLREQSIQTAKQLTDIQFEASIFIQGIVLKGIVPYRGLTIGAANQNSPSLWVERHSLQQHANILKNLPQDPYMGEGILLPKNFREAGILIGDRGFLTYYAPTTSILQEQHLPIYVAGFYDPGIIPIGGKFLLANREVISIIRASHNVEDHNERVPTNGINLRFHQFQHADSIKAQLLQALKQQGISRYWNVETYKEYEFTKEIIRELQSQKNIFTVIALVIIIVACSNIISMLIILVNDKKVEIGILRSMGATSKSIAFIFGLAGGFIGMMGSFIGIGAALLTLNNLHHLLGLISRLQGYDLFNAAFYGETVPQELSYEALLFVLVATFMISLLAGIVPAVKACLLRPSTILRSTG